MKNYHLSIQYTYMASWKESMINRLSNLINRNCSAAKISQVLCSIISMCIHIYTLGKPRLRREPVVKHCHRHRGVAQSGYYEREEMSSQCSLVGFNSHLILIFPLESLTIHTLSHSGVEIGDRLPLHTTYQL